MNGNRPMIMGTKSMVVTGQPLATRAATRILAAGGNAVDAGVAAGLVLGVVHPDMVSVGGVAPILIRPAGGETATISGLGRWPRAAKLEWYLERFGDKMPPGVLQWVIPAALDAWITALEHYGRLRFADVAADAIALARDGFVVTPFIAFNLHRQGESVWRWTENNRVFLKGIRRVPEVGERLRQPELAVTLQGLVEAGERYGSRERSLAEVRAAFYQGEWGHRLAEFCREQGGWLSPEDLAAFRVKLEPPVRATYRDLEVIGCGPWCQGPVLQMILKILEGFDLQRLGHNSPEYIHTLCESFKLAMADREVYFGDPEFVPVPLAGLLDPGYARQRADLIRHDRACPEMPPAGDPLPFDDTPWGGISPKMVPMSADRRVYTGPQAQGDPMPDTSFVTVVDAEGNIFAATPSDPATDTPLVPGLGLAGSSRGRQSRLIPGHPNSLSPWKRPRLTPMPALVLRRGQPYAVLGTPGGDVQAQAMVQVLLNIAEFGMKPQVAVEVPRFASFSFPNSFAPHEYYPGLLKVEDRISTDTRAALKELGHRVEVWPAWDWRAGGVCVIQWLPDGVLAAGADPRRESYALGC